MNLLRSLSRLVSSSNTKTCSLLRSTAHLHSFSTATRAPPQTRRTSKKTPKPSLFKFPRPSEIPFQSKVANAIHLVGSIGVPVKLQTLPDGVYAVSVLVQHNTSTDSPSPQLCIPVIFQGDLAHIAAYHLNENDLVYVTGQLSGDALPSTVEHRSEKTVEDVHGRIQVLADSLCFVQTTCPEKEKEVMHDQDNSLSDNPDVEENLSNVPLWNDLVSHPDNWWDNRSSKSNPARADFRHKKSGEQLWIHSSPEWVLPKLDKLLSGPSSLSEKKKSGNEPNSSAESLWNDLFDNPQQWWDNREKKIGTTSPDFRQKNTKNSLWLNNAPSWVLPKLDGLVFSKSNNIKSNNTSSYNLGKEHKDVNVVQTRKNQKDDLWKGLVENPNQWWDNRASKLKPTQPDFKHKDTGEALWLSSSTPLWVYPKLPPSANKRDVDKKNATQKV